MALFLLVGVSDCPYFAQLEHDFHYVSSRVPDMIITKRSFLKGADYLDFKRTEKNINDESESLLPLVLREYQAINGKCRVLGGFSEAREYLAQYYGYNEKMNTRFMKNVANENFETQLSVEAIQKATNDEIQDRILTVTVFDAVEFQVGYHFIPLLIDTLAARDPEGLISLNVVYSYSDQKATALKMELEDCAYSSLIKINMIQLLKFNKTSVKSSKYIFVFDNIDVLSPSTMFSADTLVVVHFIGNNCQDKNLELDEIPIHLNPDVKLVSTAAFSYENMIRALLAKKLSCPHAGNTPLKIRSVQISGVKVYGSLGIPNRWQADFKDVRIEGLQNSAITGYHNEHSRALEDILIDKKYITGSLQDDVETRLAQTPSQRRLVSESRAVIKGFNAILDKTGGHFVTTGRMALPHDGALSCLGFDAIENEDVKIDIVEGTSSGSQTEETHDDHDSGTEQ